MRRALIEAGRAEVELPADGNLKSARNGLFAVAYSLGLKGRFGVETVRADDGSVTLVGEA